MKPISRLANLDLLFYVIKWLLLAVIAGAANTPIASTLMAMELFGAEVGIFAVRKE